MCCLEMRVFKEEGSGELVLYMYPLVTFKPNMTSTNGHRPSKWGLLLWIEYV